MTGADLKTRERLLDAGVRAFTAKSYNGCGLKEILDAAGVPKGSFYHWFPSKEDFGIAVIQRCADLHAGVVREMTADSARSPLDRLRLYFLSVRDDFLADGGPKECLIAKIALELSELSEPMRAAVKGAVDQLAAIVADLLEQARAAGELSIPQASDELADLVINAWKGATIRMQIDRDPKHVENFVSQTLPRLLGA